MKRPYLLIKRGKVWYYKLPGERTYHSTGKTAQGHAENFAHEKSIEGARAKNPRLIEYARDFYVWGRCPWIRRQIAKGKSVTERQAQAKRAYLVKWAFPRFGTMRMEELDPVMVEDWLITLPLANGTRNSILYALKTVYKEARRANLIKVDPLVDVEPMAKLYRPRDAFSLEELRVLFPADEAGLLKVWKRPLWATFFVVLATTGMRAGEALALQWKHVLWHIPGIAVVQAVKRGGVIGPTKSGEERGMIVPEYTVNTLRWWQSKARYPGDEDLMFCQKDGRTPIGRQAPMDNYLRALDRAEISRDGRNLVVHSFRHTYNTLLKNRLPGDILREFVGHKSVAMTDRYDHGEIEDALQKVKPAAQAIIDGLWTTGR